MQVHFFLIRFNRHEYSQIIIKGCKHSISVIGSSLRVDWYLSVESTLCCVGLGLARGAGAESHLMENPVSNGRRCLSEKKHQFHPLRGGLSPCSESMEPEFWSRIVYNHRQVRNHKKHIPKHCPFLCMVTAVCCLPYSPDICMVFYSELLI